MQYHDTVMSPGALPLSEIQSRSQQGSPVLVATAAALALVMAAGALFLF